MTSKATLDTPTANIQRYISVFPGKTNLVERTCLIESGEGRSWGLKLAKRGFIEATYTTVFMIRASSLDNLRLPTIRLSMRAHLYTCTRC